MTIQSNNLYFLKSLLYSGNVRFVYKRCEEKADWKTLKLVSGCGDPGIKDLRENRRFMVSTRLNFSCSKDYVLVGSHFISCEEDGTWSSPAPVCRCKFQIFF